MPVKLRKSRSRNVTKSNNRPASKQSRNRKTPNGKGNTNGKGKRTRRRVKRGGMNRLFGKKSDEKKSDEKKSDKKKTDEQIIAEFIKENSDFIRKSLMLKYPEEDLIRQELKSQLSSNMTPNAKASKQYFIKRDICHDVQIRASEKILSLLDEEKTEVFNRLYTNTNSITKEEFLLELIEEHLKINLNEIGNLTCFISKTTKEPVTPESSGN